MFNCYMYEIKSAFYKHSHFSSLVKYFFLNLIKLFSLKFNDQHKQVLIPWDVSYKKNEMQFGHLIEYIL